MTAPTDCLPHPARPTSDVVRDVRRVLLVSPRFSSGGAERCARELYLHLPTHGIKTRMLVARRESGEPVDVRGVRLPGEKYLRAIEWLGRPVDWRHVGSTIALAGVRSTPGEVVHLHNLHGGWISLRAVRRLTGRLPSVWTLHDEWAVTHGIPYDCTRVMSSADVERHFGQERAPFLDPSHPRASKIRRVVGSLMPRPAAIICPSAYLAALARRTARFDGLPILEVPYGVTLLTRPESQMSPQAARAELGLAPDTKVIAVVAANFDSPYKGMWLAREALRGMRADEAVVLVMGRSTAALTQGLQLRVVDLGFVTSESKLATAYRAADLTLIPSIADNLPYVALESMSCGVPIVTNRVGGLVDLVGDDERGITSRSLDAAGLLGALRQMLGDAARAAAAGRAGRAWAVDNCGMDVYLRRTMAVYELALQGAARQPSRI